MTVPVGKEETGLMARWKEEGTLAIEMEESSMPQKDRTGMIPEEESRSGLL